MADDDVERPPLDLPDAGTDAVPHLWPGELDADYTLQGELGRGGMAVVFRALDRSLGRDVAVKVVRPRFAADEEAVARLAREARTVAQLEHPNIVGVYSIRHLADRSVALVMQLIPGRTLKQAVTEDGPFDPGAAEQVLRDIARALAYAHRAGVVHRDVKPENIFLDAGSGRAMLSDFGVARVMDAPTELTATGTTIGTPTYMAPEQIDGVNLDGRSDLYSLGMVGWEMLTGERPWAGESLYSVIYRQKHDQLTPIDAYREDVPPKLQYLIEGLMPKNPDRRWASAARFLTLLSSDQMPPGFKEWESAQRRRRRTRVFQEARQRGDSVIGAALETVKFSRSPTPVAPLAQGARRTTPAAAAPEEQFFEPTGDAARRATPATLPRATSLAAIARGTPSGGFSIQRPPHLAHTRVTTPVPAVPARARAKRAGVAVLATGALAILAWMQFGPASATELEPIPFPVVLNDDRAVDVPVLPPDDSVAVVTTDSASPKGGSAPSTPDSAAAAPASAASTAPASPSPTTTASRASTGRPSGTTERPVTSPPTAPPTTPRLDSALVEPVAPPVAVPVVPAVTFPTFVGTVAAGRNHSCVLASDGRAACWGSNDNGQLGDGSVESRPAPALVAGDLTFSQISSGTTHTCGLTTGNEVFCWGANSNGQLGDATTQIRTAPVRINTTVSFRQVSAGRDHTCGISSSRAVLCWGVNTDGQVGDGSRQRRSSPVMVDLARSAAALAVGWSHTCALTSDGTAWCWGNNDAGQLGDGTTTARATPTRVAFDGAFSSIAAGASHTCAIAAGSGEAWCWGRNSTGQLGSGSTTGSSTPRQVSGTTPYSTIVAGAFFTCARGRDASVWCWGANNYGQLGDGTSGNRTVPGRVTGLARVASLSAGGAHACANTERGETYCWGNNVDGQISRNDRDPASSPIRVLLPPR